MKGIEEQYKKSEIAEDREMGKRVGGKVKARGLREVLESLGTVDIRAVRHQETK